MQLLEPLRVIQLRFSSRHLLDVACVDEHDLEAARLQDLEDGNPVHMPCMASSSGSLNAWTATSAHTGTCAAMCPPKRPYAIHVAKTTMLSTSSANGGGVRSHSRSTPDTAAVHDAAIQRQAARTAKEAARVAVACVAPERRQAVAVPHASRHTSTTGMTINASGAGPEFM